MAQRAFALLMFLPNDNPDNRFALDRAPGLDATTESLDDEPEHLFEEPERLTNLVWLGVADQVHVTDRRRLVLSTGPEPDPRVSNSEMKRSLRWRVHWAWRAALLVESETPLDGPGWIFMGTCAEAGGAVGPLLKDISALSEEPTIARPFYISTKSYLEGYRQRTHSIDRTSWHRDWLKFDRLLC